MNSLEEPAVKEFSIWNMANYKHLTDAEYEAIVRQDSDLNKWRDCEDWPRIKKRIHEHIAETGREGQYMKLMALYDDLMETEEELSGRCRSYETAKTKNRPYLELAIIAYFIPDNVKRLEKIERDTNRLEAVLFNRPGNENVQKNTITDSMIERARDYPIDTLLDITRGFTLCLWHNDSKPSMYTKNNFVHCFSCGKTADAIDVYRKINGATFPEAVRALQ